MNLLYRLLDKKHYIVLCLMAGAVVFNAFAFFCVPPTYQSTAMLYVVSSMDDSVPDQTGLDMGEILAKDYEEMICGDQILEEVQDALQLDISIDALRNMIAVENPENTRILNITVISTDREEAMDIANQVAVAATGHLSGMSTDNIAQYAKPAEEKTGPNYMIYTLIGAMIGTLLFCDCVIIRYLRDDSIYTADDMEKAFDSVTLAVIPENVSLLK